MKPVKLALCTILLGTAATAQQPLSAIGWLDEIVSAPLTIQPETFANEPPVTETAVTPKVDVMPISPASPDAAGLLPSSTTGLPKSLWSASKTADLVSELERLPNAPLPAIQALYYTLLLAEADAPNDTNDGASLLVSRINALKEFGAVEPARALIERAGPAHPELFDLWLDLSLLSGTEDEACKRLREQPALSKRYAARIFCIARTGDWATAALTYDTALALDVLSPLEADLLAQFLDPEAIESDSVPTAPKNLSPLLFRLYEALGHPLPTRRYPRAFAMADLRNTVGWKAEIEAAERLAQSGALPANHLLGLYTERRPAASGGVWDRVRAIQALDNALKSNDKERTSQSLPKAWNALQRHSLEVVFSQLFAGSLRDAKMPPQQQELAFLITLLSPEYETAAGMLAAPTKRQKFLIGLAQGTPDTSFASTAAEQAIIRGFTADTAAAEHQNLLNSGKLGQTILTAATQLDRAGTGNLHDLTSALQTLRFVGLEDTARRAALQLLIFEDA